MIIKQDFSTQRSFVGDWTPLSLLMQCKTLLFIFLILILIGCTQHKQQANHPSSLEAPEIEMSGILIKAGHPVLSAEELFEEGIGAFQGQLFARCEERLHTYLRYFSDEIYTHPAHYNLGLCLELQRKNAQAAEHFRAFVEASTEESDYLDGQVRLGYNLIFSAQFVEAEQLYSHLLTSYPVKGFDRAECHLRRAIAYTALGQYAEADRDLGNALGHINGSIGSYRSGNELLAETHFQRGELYRHFMSEIQLKFPLEEIKRNVSDKVRFFKRSLYAFVEAIKVNHTYWAIASGHQLGVLHEDIYEDLLNSDYPPDFDDESLAYYYFELEKKLIPLLRESISIYERTITLSSKQGAQNEWVRSTQESLLRLRELEADIQHRLSLDPIEAYKLRKSKPFRRKPSTVPLPPISTDRGSHEHSPPLSSR